MKTFKKVMAIFGISFGSLAGLLGIIIGIMFLAGSFSKPAVEIVDIQFEKPIYEFSDDFTILIKANPDTVTQTGLILSFDPETAGKITENNGFISDGIISVPKNVEAGKEFQVKIAKTYLDFDGEQIVWNKGGISKIIAKSVNEKINPTKAEIRVDVPVHHIETKFYKPSDTTFEGPMNSVVAGSNFVAKSEFFPKNSRFKFSSTTEEKKVLYEISPEQSAYIEKVSGESDLFKALLEKQGVFFKTKAFANSVLENEMLSGTNLTGEELYNYLLGKMDENNSVIENITDLEFKNYSVGEISIEPEYEGKNYFNLNVNQKFTLYANHTAGGNSGNLGVKIISDVGNQNLENKISDVGIILEVPVVTDADRLQDKDGDGYITASTDKVKFISSNVRVVDGKSYYLANLANRDINLSFWELVAQNELDNLRASVVLLQKGSDGDYTIFDNEKLNFALKSTFAEETMIDWDGINTNEQIQITIVADEDGNKTDTFYLNHLTSVPSTNTYKKVVFFAYFDEVLNYSIDEASKVLDVKSEQMFNINGKEYKLFELDGDRVRAVGDGEFKVLFMTVLTDYEGDPILDEAGNYQMRKVSGTGNSINSLSFKVATTMTKLSGLLVVKDGYKKPVDIETGVDVLDKIAFVTNTKSALSLEIDCTGEKDIFINAFGSSIKIVAKNGEEVVPIGELFDFKIFKKDGTFNTNNFIIDDANIFEVKGQDGLVTRQYIKIEINFKAPAFNAGADSKEFKIALSYQKTSTVLDIIEPLTTIETLVEGEISQSVPRKMSVELYDGTAKKIKFALHERTDIAQRVMENGIEQIYYPGTKENPIVVVQTFNVAGQSEKKQIVQSTKDGVTSDYELRDYEINPVIIWDKYGRELANVEHTLLSSSDILVVNNDDKSINYNGIGDASLQAKAAGIESGELMFNITSGKITNLYINKIDDPTTKQSELDEKLIYENVDVGNIGKTMTAAMYGVGSSKIYIKSNTPNREFGPLKVLYGATPDTDPINISDAFSYKIKQGSLDYLSADSFNALNGMIKINGNSLETIQALYATEISTLNIEKDFGTNLTLQLEATAGNGIFKFNVEFTILSNLTYVNNIVSHDDSLTDSVGSVVYKGVYANADIAFVSDISTRGFKISREKGSKTEDIKVDLFAYGFDKFGNPVLDKGALIMNGDNFQFNPASINAITKYEIRLTLHGVGENNSHFGLNTKIYFNVSPNFKIAFSGSYDEQYIFKFADHDTRIDLNEVIKVYTAYPGPVAIEETEYSFSLGQGAKNFTMAANTNNVILILGQPMTGVHNLEVIVTYNGATASKIIKVAPDIEIDKDFINKSPRDKEALRGTKEDGTDFQGNADNLIFSEIDGVLHLVVKTGVNYFIDSAKFDGLTDTSTKRASPQLYRAFKTTTSGTPLAISFKQESGIITTNTTSGYVTFGLSNVTEPLKREVEVTLEDVGSVTYSIYILPIPILPIIYDEKGKDGAEYQPGPGNTKANKDITVLLSGYSTLKELDIYDIFEAGKDYATIQNLAGSKQENVLNIFAKNLTFEVFNENAADKTVYAKVDLDTLKLNSVSSEKFIILKCTTNGFVFYYRIKIIPDAKLANNYPFMVDPLNKVEYLSFNEKSPTSSYSILNENGNKFIEVDLNANFGADVPNNTYIAPDESSHPQSRFMYLSIHGIPKEYVGSCNFVVLSLIIDGKDMTGKSDLVQIVNKNGSSIMRVNPTSSEVRVVISKRYDKFNDTSDYTFEINTKPNLGKGVGNYNVIYPQLGNKDLTEISLNAGADTSAIAVDGKKTVNFFNALELKSYTTDNIESGITEKMYIYCSEEFGAWNPSTKVFTAYENITRTSSFDVILYTPYGEYGRITIKLNSLISVVGKDTYIEKLADKITANNSYDLSDKIQVVQWNEKDKVAVGVYVKAIKFGFTSATWQIETEEAGKGKNYMNFTFAYGKTGSQTSQTIKIFEEDCGKIEEGGTTKGYTKTMFLNEIFGKQTKEEVESIELSTLSITYPVGKDAKAATILTEVNAETFEFTVGGVTNNVEMGITPNGKLQELSFYTDKADAYSLSRVNAEVNRGNWVFTKFLPGLGLIESFDFKEITFAEVGTGAPPAYVTYVKETPSKFKIAALKEAKTLKLTVKTSVKYKNIEESLDYIFDYTLTIESSVGLDEDNKGNESEANPIVAGESLVFDFGRIFKGADIDSWNSENTNGMGKAGYKIEILDVQGDITALDTSNGFATIEGKNFTFKTVAFNKSSTVKAIIKLSYASPNNTAFQYTLSGSYTFTILSSENYITNTPAPSRDESGNFAELGQEFAYIEDYNAFVKNKINLLESAPLAEDKLIVSIAINQITATTNLKLKITGTKTDNSESTIFKDFVLSSDNSRTAKTFTYLLSNLGLSSVTGVDVVSEKGDSQVESTSKPIKSLSWGITKARVANLPLKETGINNITDLDQASTGLKFKLNSLTSSNITVHAKNAAAGNADVALQVSNGRVVIKGTEFTGYITGADIWFEGSNLQSQNNVIFSVYTSSDKLLGNYQIVLTNEDIYSIKTNMLNSEGGVEKFFQEDLLTAGADNNGQQIFNNYQILSFKYKPKGGAIDAIETTKTIFYTVGEFAALPDGKTQGTQIGNYIKDNDNKYRKIIAIDVINSASAGLAKLRAISPFGAPEVVSALAFDLSSSLYTKASDYVVLEGAEKPSMKTRLEFTYNKNVIDYKKATETFAYRELSTEFLQIKFTTLNAPEGTPKTNFPIQFKLSAKNKNGIVINSEQINIGMIAYDEKINIRTIVLDLKQIFKFTDFSNYTFSLTDIKDSDKFNYVISSRAPEIAGTTAKPWAEAATKPTFKAELNDYSVGNSKVDNTYEIQFAFGAEKGFTKTLGGVYTFSSELDFMVESESIDGRETYIPITAGNDKLLIETFGLKHKNGQLFKAEDFKNEKISLKLEVIGENNPTTGDTSIKFLEVSPQYDAIDKRVVNHIIKVNGAPNEGIKVELKITYTVNGISSEKFIVVKCMPNWSITMKNMGDGSVNSESNPSPVNFNIEGTASTTFNLTQDNSACSIFAVESNNPNVQAANLFNYAFYAQGANVRLNDAEDLGFIDAGNDAPLDTNKWVAKYGDGADKKLLSKSFAKSDIGGDKKVDVIFKPAKFGYKNLALTMTDDYGYMETYFIKLVPITTTPNFDKWLSDTILYESETFDVASNYTDVSGASEKPESVTMTPSMKEVDKLLLIKGVSAQYSHIDNAITASASGDILNVYVAGIKLFIGNKEVEGAIKKLTGWDTERVSTRNGLTIDPFKRFKLNMIPGEIWGADKNKAAVIKLTLEYVKESTTTNGGTTVPLTEKCTIDAPVYIQKRYTISADENFVIRDGVEFNIKNYISATDNKTSSNLGKFSFNGNMTYIPNIKAGDTSVTNGGAFSFSAYPTSGHGSLVPYRDRFGIISMINDKENVLGVLDMASVFPEIDFTSESSSNSFNNYHIFSSGDHILIGKTSTGNITIKNGTQTLGDVSINGLTKETIGANYKISIMEILKGVEEVASWQANYNNLTFNLGATAVANNNIARGLFAQDKLFKINIREVLKDGSHGTIAVKLSDDTSLTVNLNLNGEKKVSAFVSKNSSLTNADFGGAKGLDETLALAGEPISEDDRIKLKGIDVFDDNIKIIFPEGKNNQNIKFSIEQGTMGKVTKEGVVNDVFKGNGPKKQVSQVSNNDYSSTKYASISKSLGIDTLGTADTCYQITIDENKAGATLSYGIKSEVKAESTYQEISKNLETMTIKPLKTSITNDTVCIDHADAFNVDANKIAVVNKSYVVRMEGRDYIENIPLRVSPYLYNTRSVGNTGRNLSIEAEAAKVDDQYTYTLAFSDWASLIQVQTARKEDSYKSIDFKLLSEFSADLKTKIKFVITKEGAGAGAATISEVGVITTGSGFNVADQFIRVQIFIVTAGPSGKYDVSKPIGSLPASGYVNIGYFDISIKTKIKQS